MKKGICLEMSESIFCHNNPQVPLKTYIQTLFGSVHKFISLTLGGDNVPHVNKKINELLCKSLSRTFINTR